MTHWCFSPHRQPGSLASDQDFYVLSLCLPTGPPLCASLEEERRVISRFQRHQAWWDCGSGMKAAAEPVEAGKIPEPIASCRELKGSADSFGDP